MLNTKYFECIEKDFVNWPQVRLSTYLCGLTCWKASGLTLWVSNTFLPTCWSLRASPVKSFQQGDCNYHHGNTNWLPDTHATTGLIKVHDWRAWNVMGAVTELHSSLEWRPCVHACVCVCVCAHVYMLVTLRVQQSLYPQVLFCFIKGVFQSVNYRRLLLHRAPVKKLRSARRKKVISRNRNQA